MNNLLVEEQVKPLVKLTYDIMFKELFTRCSDILIRFIVCVLELKDVDINNYQLQYLSKDLPVDTVNEYKKNTDLRVLIDDKYAVTIEMNSVSYIIRRRRNYLYHCKNVSSILKSGSKKNINQYVFYQINLNPIEKSSMVGVDRAFMIWESTGEAMFDDDIIYCVYLDYCRKLYYNGNIRLTYHHLPS